MIQSTLVFVLRRLREANFREKREMRKLNPLLKRGLKAIENGDLLKILQSEIRHEISHPRFQVNCCLPLSFFFFVALSNLSIEF